MFQFMGMLSVVFIPIKGYNDQTPNVDDVSSTNSHSEDDVTNTYGNVITNAYSAGDDVTRYTESGTGSLRREHAVCES